MNLFRNKKKNIRFLKKIINVKIYFYICGEKVCKYIQLTNTPAMKIIVADSGSTKTSWYLLRNDGTVDEQCRTSGINPFFQQSSEIVKTLQEELPAAMRQTDTVFFYGAGVANQQKKNELFGVFSTFFKVTDIQLESDMLAAARSLCGNERGIASILGTGSNSCFYDGEKIAGGVPSLGYILGDEGSGSYLGRLLVKSIFRNQFPSHLIDRFKQDYEGETSTLLHKVYSQPYPNRYLAGFTRFLSDHLHEEAVQQLIRMSFRDFINGHIKLYDNARDMELHFTGSIASVFSVLLKEVIQEAGLKAGKIEADPGKGLIRYHQNKLLQNS